MSAITVYAHGKRGPMPDSLVDPPDDHKVSIQHGAEVWEGRKAYGPAGFAGLFTNPYTLLFAAFISLGGPCLVMTKVSSVLF